MCTQPKLCERVSLHTCVSESARIWGGRSLCEGACMCQCAGAYVQVV